MTELQAIMERHAVRSYTDEKLSPSVIAEIKNEISTANREGGLSIRLVSDEPKAFDSFMAHYGKFSGVKNYIVLAGRKKDKKLDEKLGYYGEKIAIKAQMLGLNTCWVAMSFSKGTAKKSCKLDSNDKIVCVLALGKGAVKGVPHKSKQMTELCEISGSMPDWCRSGMEAVMLAPTAMNQQKFLFTLDGNKVSAESKGGFYSLVDLGIAKYHFEVGAGKENFEWEYKMK